MLDEVQFIKRRHEEKNKESQRRHNLGVLLTKARKKNSQVKVIGMSATPVTNDLEEGKSLLQYITGKMYEDLATRGTVKMLCHCIKSYPQSRSERYQNTNPMFKYMMT